MGLLIFQIIIVTKIKIAMIASPWLDIPPVGYGGIENMLAKLIPRLMAAGLDIELFTVKTSQLVSTLNHWIYDLPQYKYIHNPGYESMPIILGHLAYSINVIKNRNDFDIIHDHNGYIGPMIFNFSENKLPPTIHTLHGPPFDLNHNSCDSKPDNLILFNQLSASNNLSYVPISRAMAKSVPNILKSKLLTHVYNGVEPNEFPFILKKEPFFVQLARIHPEKGQKIAIETALATRIPLILAGPISNIANSDNRFSHISNSKSSIPSSVAEDYFANSILPFLNDNLVEYVGNISGTERLKLISTAKAMLFPIQWEEPFGMAVIEALACGTPVVAMAKGAMTEIIEHGINGFLANTKEEFIQYAKIIDEIDPKNCRQSVESKFSADQMARGYLKHYATILNLKIPIDTD